MTREDTNDLLENYTDIKCPGFYAQIRDNDTIYLDDSVTWEQFKSISYILDAYFNERES